MDPEQRGVIRNGGMALAVTIIACLAGLLLPPIALPASDAIADRLAFALRADLFVLVWLIAAVGNVANARFHSPKDIGGGGLTEPSPDFAIRRAILQNTHEQVTLAVGVHLVLATLLPHRTMGLIPILVLLFCLGRASFWRGYARGAAARAFGFGLTFYPTVLAAFLCLALILFS